jgi:hypothetical protein
MKKNFQIIKYSLYYIFIFLITHFIWVYFIGVPKIGISTLYKTHIIIAPFYNYLVLSKGVIQPLDKDLKVKKKDITNIFLIITSLFNFFFYRYLNFNMLEIGIIVISNIIEFLLIKPPVHKVAIITQKNIDDYFKKRKKE